MLFLLMGHIETEYAYFWKKFVTKHRPVVWVLTPPGSGRSGILQIIIQCRRGCREYLILNQDVYT